MERFSKISIEKELVTLITARKIQKKKAKGLSFLVVQNRMNHTLRATRFLIFNKKLKYTVFSSVFVHYKIRLMRTLLLTITNS